MGVAIENLAGEIGSRIAQDRLRRSLWTARRNICGIGWVGRQSWCSLASSVLCAQKRLIQQSCHSYFCFVLFLFGFPSMRLLGTLACQLG